MPQFTFNLVNATQELDFNALNSAPIQPVSGINSRFSEHLQQQSYQQNNRQVATAAEKSAASSVGSTRPRSTSKTDTVSRKQNTAAERSRENNVAEPKVEQNEKTQTAPTRELKTSQQREKTSQAEPNRNDNVQASTQQEPIASDEQATTENSLAAQQNDEVSQQAAQELLLTEESLSSDQILALLAQSNQFDVSATKVSNNVSEGAVEQTKNDTDIDVDFDAATLMQKTAVSVDELTDEQQALIAAKLAELKPQKPVVGDGITPIKPGINIEKVISTKNDNQVKPENITDELITEQLVKPEDVDEIILDPRERQGFAPTKNLSTDPEQHIWQKQLAQLAPANGKTVDEKSVSQVTLVNEQPTEKTALSDDMLKQLNQLEQMQKSGQANAQHITTKTTNTNAQDSNLQQVLNKLAENNSSDAMQAEQLTGDENQEQGAKEQKSADNTQVLINAQATKNNDTIKTSHILGGTQFAQEQHQLSDSEQQTALAVEQASNKTVASHQTQQKTLVQLQQALNLHRKDAADAIKDKVMVMIHQKIQQVDIRLDPPELGSMQVKVHMHQDGAQLSFVVSNPQAKDLIDQNMARLRDMLQQQGVNVADANVEQQKQQMEQQQQQAAFAGTGRNGSSNVENDVEQLDGQALAAQLVKASATGVDYYA